MSETRQTYLENRLAAAERELREFLAARSEALPKTADDAERCSWKTVEDQKRYAVAAARNALYAEQRRTAIDSGKSEGISEGAYVTYVARYEDEDDETEMVEGILMPPTSVNGIESIIDVGSPIGKALMGHDVGDTIEVLYTIKGELSPHKVTVKVKKVVPASI